MLLIQKGANVNTKNEEIMHTHLHDAYFFGDSRIVNLLLQYGADKNACNYKGLKPIELASSTQ